MRLLKTAFGSFCRSLSLLLRSWNHNRSKQKEHGGCAHSGMQEIFDLVIVMPPDGAQGWILDAFSREIAVRAGNLRTTLCRAGSKPPPAREYFFSHYMFFFESLSRAFSIQGGRSHVFATHIENEKHGISMRALTTALNTADSIICMNSGLARYLEARGVSRRKLHVAVGAVDPQLFRGHVRKEDGFVGFNAAYYPRKAPDVILQIVDAMPHRKFLLLGKGWAQYPRFVELLSKPNFEYVDAPFSAYPEHYARMSVFVSASMLEGGPIPLIEAMMSNVVPVSSSTGFAPDVIQHGVNGFLFDVGASPEVICRLIELAYSLDGEVRHTVKHLNWNSFAAKVFRIMSLDGVCCSLASSAPDVGQDTDGEG